jgi:hypothetical protein
MNMIFDGVTSLGKIVTKVLPDLLQPSHFFLQWHAINIQLSKSILVRKQSIPGHCMDK